MTRVRAMTTRYTLRQRLSILIALAGLAVLANPAFGQAQGWPQRPIRLLVPFAAGGNIDVMGRLMASRLSETIGQQVIVENRVGGNGIIATEAVARSAPDGYTMLWASTSVVAIVPAAAKVSYDPVKDLAPVGAMTAGPQALLVGASVPAKTVQEFVAWVKAQPQKVSYGGGGGPASASNLIMSLFQQRAGIAMTNISYKGTAPAMNDLIGGHIPVMFAPVSEAFAQAGNPKVRLLAVSSIKRSLMLPDVPTIAESGFPGFDAVSWTGMMAPAGTPKEIIDRLGAEMVRAAKDPKFVDQIVKAGNDPLGFGPDEFARMIAQEIPAWGEAVRNAGVKLN